MARMSMRICKHVLTADFWGEVGACFCRDLLEAPEVHPCQSDDSCPHHIRPKFSATRATMFYKFDKKARTPAGVHLFRENASLSIVSDASVACNSGKSWATYINTFLLLFGARRKRSVVASRLARHSQNNQLPGMTAFLSCVRPHGDGSFG